MPRMKPFGVQVVNATCRNGKEERQIKRRGQDREEAFKNI